jgi:hypothetical protein
MLTVLRRSRSLALALVLLAPGISGTAVQWLHACPVDSPQGVADHQHHGSNRSDSGQPPTCQCIGACNTASVLLPPKVVTVAATIRQPDLAVPPTGPSFLPVGTPSDLLPPATAPPLS